jgi:GNAT superfamily N-acetyltransferase
MRQHFRLGALLYFTCAVGGLDAVTLEQAAALCAIASARVEMPAQPAARARVIALQSAPDALICLGKENDEVLALAAGAIQQSGQSRVLKLEEFCVARDRRRAGIGGELLDFVLRQSMLRGAAAAIVKANRCEACALFFQRRGFAPVEAKPYLLRQLSL